MQPHPPAPGSVLVVGGGYLGGRAADAWLAAGRTVFVLTRGRAAELSARGFIPIIGDVLDSATLAKLPAVETVLYAVGLDRSAGRSMRDVYVGGVGNVAANVPTPAKFIYISSTSVYAQAGGEWVDEDSETAPREESGRVVLDAERELRRHVAGAG